MPKYHQLLPASTRLHVITNDMFIDFNQLAKNYPALQSHLLVIGHRTTIDFSNQRSLIVLTQAIMQSVFGINFVCPYMNLCPRVPSRLNYLLWIDKFVPTKIAHVLDIGTGATAIYPLLGWAAFKWTSLAIETNEDSVRSSQKLVKLNGLEDQITVIKVSEQQDVFDFAVGQGNGNIDVVLCNPPFFESISSEENEIGRTPKGQMLSQQFACSGGQYSFFFNIYRASFRHVTAEGERIASNKVEAKYFTCLLGRQTSFIEACKFLLYEMEYGVLEIMKVGQIRQGHNARFVVMWRPKPTKTS